jgi:hypothetical protein
LIYSLILPSSLVGVVHEESAAIVFTTVRAADSDRLAKLPGSKQPNAQTDASADGLNQKGRLERTA